MGRFVTGLFRGGKPSSPPATSLRAQSSIYGLPVPVLIAGQQRIGSVLIWYGGLFSVNESTPGAGGGKGGFFVGSGQGTSQYYYASIDFALCEGQIAGVKAIWPHTKPRLLNDWAQSFSTSAVAVSATVFTGGYSQGTWGYLDAKRPDQSLANRGLAHVGVVNYPLGPSAQLPNVNWEPYAANSYLSGPNGLPDGDPSIAVNDFLTNVHWGVGFPSSRLGSLTLYQQYCLANGLLVSPALASQVVASSFLTDLLSATNTLARWSSGVLTLVPYGDQAIYTGQALTAIEARTIVGPVTAGITVNHASTFISDQGVVFTVSGNPLTLVSISHGPGPGQYTQRGGVYKFNSNDVGKGVTISYQWAATASYVPQNQVIYDLTLDDFLPNQGSIGSGTAPSNNAVIFAGRDPSQVDTSISVEFLDRSNRYNPGIVEVKDDASILLYGRPRKSAVKQMHVYCLAAPAQFAAQQLLTREQIPGDYQFTLGRWAILLDVGDIVTLSVPAQNLFRQGVRIKEITENSGDRSLTFIAEEYMGTAGAPLFGTEAPAGYQPATDADPGNTIAQLFEPTAELLGGAAQAVWAACCGGVNWGGCYVWVSTDGGSTYKQAGTIAGPARMGVTTTGLPSVTVNQNGATVDNTNTLGVDLTESSGALISASASDALALRTACYVDGEIIAYQTATLTATSKYNLTQLIRGAYGTEANVVTHASGVPFCRLDAGIFQYPFNQADVGTTIFLKFQSFNLFGDSPQSLAAIAPIAYAIKGTALASPLPTLTNLTSTLVDLRLGLSWDEIGSHDFRSDIRYEIRAGATFDGAMTLSVQAHPPFVLPAGTNTYWVTGWCQPVPGLIVRSEAPVSIAVSNPQVVTNIIADYELKSLGWPGTFVNAGVDTSLNAVRTAGAGNILSEANILSDPDILNLGGQASGIYDPGIVVDIGRVDTCPVYAMTVGTGIPVGQNILSDLDVLTDPDILGSVSAAFVNIYPEIAFSATVNPPTNWQKFVPGKFVGRYFKMRWQLVVTDPETIGYLLDAEWSVDVPDRVDHPLINGTLAAGGHTFAFQPDGAASTAIFNGGPGGSPLPSVTVSWGDMAAGDIVNVTGLSASGCTVQILNGGLGVQRNKVSIFIEGW